MDNNSALTFTRTVEVVVCKTCEEQVRPNQSGHWFTCPSCFQVFCCNAQTRLSVSVTENIPFGYPRTDEQLLAGSGGKRRGEYEYRAAFCLNCAARVEQILTAAGLVKAKQPTQDSVVLDASAGLP